MISAWVWTKVGEAKSGNAIGTIINIEYIIFGSGGFGFFLLADNKKADHHQQEEGFDWGHDFFLKVAILRMQTLYFFRWARVALAC